jgi:hypothetical protein
MFKRNSYKGLILCMTMLSYTEAHAEFAGPVIRKIKEFYGSASAIIFICGCVSLFWGIGKLMIDSRADVKWPITIAIILIILGAFDTVVNTIGVVGW